MGTEIELDLLGHKMKLKTDGDTDFVNEVLTLARGRLEVIDSRSKGVAAHHLALLALLDLAEEYVSAKRRFETRQAALEAKFLELTQLSEPTTQ